MSLDDKVATWISTQGYPLELRVGDMIRASGGWWDHGRIYVDPETGKVREIDVMAVFHPLGHPRESSVQLVIECKHTTDKPWVVFTTEQRVLSALGHLHGLPHTEAADAALSSLSHANQVDRMRTVVEPEREGFRLVKALTPAQDTAHQAVGTLMSAGRALAEKMSRSGFRILFVPVVVLDGPLFESYLPAGSEELVTQRVQSATLIHSRDSGDRMPIKVVTLEALPGFLADVADDAIVWSEMMGFGAR